VRASVVGSGGAAYLTLRTPDGASSSLRVTAQETGGGDAADLEGLSALAFAAPAEPLEPGGPPRVVRNLRETQAAQDARFMLNGVELTSASNTAASVIEGVTLTLRQVTTTPADLTVAVDTGALRKNITEFMNAVNMLTRTVLSQTQAEGGGSRGPLQADSTAVGLLGSLRELLRGEVTGGAALTLNAAGVAFQRDGTLAAVEARLVALLDKPQELARLFSQPQAGPDPRSRGLAVRLKEWAGAIAGDQGALSNRMTSLNGSTKLNEKQQEALQEKLARTEARLRAQYQRLDSQMSQLNGQVGRLRSALGLNTGS
jgi:flagellar hook-associated protein 2